MQNARVAVTKADFCEIRFDKEKGVHVCGDVEFPSGQVLIDFEIEC